MWKRRIVSAAVIVVLAFGLTGCREVLEEMRSGAGAEPVVTPAEFSKLTEGMSEQEAAKIIGATPDPGQSSDREGSDGSKESLRVWVNPDGSMAMLTFRDGELVSIDQYDMTDSSK